ncbi:hypothetical protein D7V91_09350 [bacterium 1xD42-67]|nr:hypothetical protein D7V91_09350 [bacterium 1xD42-67]
MDDILKTLFLDNPYIPEQVCAFCKQLPEFREAERAYEETADRLRARLGAAEVDTFDEVLSRYLARYVHTYYLFGLSLRQEVLSALGQAG